METTGDRIRSARTNAGMKQWELGQKAGVCQATIMRMEANHTASFFTVAQVAKVLKVSLDWIAYGDKNEKDNHQHRVFVLNG